MARLMTSSALARPAGTYRPIGRSTSLRNSFVALHTVTDIPDRRERRSAGCTPAPRTPIPAAIVPAATAAATAAAAAAGTGGPANSHNLHRHRRTRARTIVAAAATAAGNGGAAGGDSRSADEEGEDEAGAGSDAGSDGWSATRDSGSGSGSDGDGDGGGGGGGSGGGGSGGSGVAAQVARHAWHRPDVGVVLVHPQIPQNSGNVARTCAATGVPLHLVGPLGFQLDDRKLKRAGLDYWDSVAVSVHISWPHFFAFFRSLPAPKRLVAFTVYGDSYYAGPEFAYRPGDWLLFGAETSGLPPEAHADVLASGGALVKIPIRDTHVRSINLAVAAGVGLFEAIRQLDEQSGAGHEVTPRQSPSLAEVAASHRDGKRLAKPHGRAQQPSL